MTFAFIFKVILFDFINLTQMHNFTVSAQYIFTFRRLSVFTNADNKTFCTVPLTSQVVMIQSYQPKDPEFASSTCVFCVVFFLPLFDSFN